MTKRLYRVERTFSGRAALRRVERFSTTPPRWAHRLESGAVWGANLRRRRTSSIIYPRRGRALREAPTREATRRQPKFNLRRDAHPELARAAPSTAADPRTADARSCGVARRAARAARRRGTGSSVNKIHFYIGPKTRQRAARSRRADAARRPYETKRAVVRYFRAAFLSQFEGREEPGALSGAQFTRTCF